MRQPSNDGGGSTTAFWREIIPQESSAFKKKWLWRGFSSINGPLMKTRRRCECCEHVLSLTLRNDS